MQDEAVRNQLDDLFQDRGLIVFEDVEPTPQMHLAISNVFGPLKDHPVAAVPRADQETMPGVIDMRCEPNSAGVVEIDNKRLSQWLPWHFDHCYNNELNRAGVLRALEIPPEGGLTGFTDCIALYDAVSPEIRSKIEGRNIVYTLDLAYCNMRFGKPRTFREILPHPGHHKMTELAKTLPRAIHPAVFTRATGEKVLHVSPWMAVAIEGQENPEGDALLAAVCNEILDKVQPYFHRWQPTDMLIWDNWRSASLGERARPEICAPYAANDHQRRLRPRLFREQSHRRQSAGDDGLSDEHRAFRRDRSAPTQVVTPKRRAAQALARAWKMALPIAGPMGPTGASPMMSKRS